MDNKKKIIYILSLIGVALLMVILFLVFNFATQGDKNADISEKVKLPESIETTQSTKDSLVRTRKSLEETLAETRKMIDRYIENSPKNIAEVYASVEECGKITDDEEKNRCIILWAEYSKNIDLCDSVTGDTKNKCLNSSIPAIALEKNDLSLCSGIADSSYKRSCIYKVAVAPNSPLSVCDALLTPEEKQYCQFSITMKTKNNIEQCQSITDAKIKDMCINSFYPES